MSVTEEPRSSVAMADFSMPTPADRRSDIDVKHQRVASLMREIGSDGLLVLRPENFAWMTSGSPPRSTLDPGAAPAVFFNQEGRWLVCSNADTQRFFDEEIDGLGFQLKEWPWQWGRGPLLADLAARAREFAEYMFSPQSAAAAARAVYMSLLTREH